MSAQSFALTSPSLTDMSDAINLAEARARFYDADRQGDAALAAWARTYAPPLLERADEAPSEEAVSEDIKEAREEAAHEADSAHAAEIDDLLTKSEPAFAQLGDAFKQFGKLRDQLAAIVERDKAAA